MAQVDTAVCIVGAGPGGLAVATDLIDAGITDVLVLDRGKIGQSWLDYPPETRLLSESSPTVDDNRIDGIPVGDVIANIPHPTHEMYQRYLDEVARRKNIAVREQQEVVSVARDSTGRFVLKTATGDSCTCKALVWATGMYATPDEHMDSHSCYIHYSRISDWKHINDTHVTVIGGANGATEVILQLAAPGRTVTLITPKEYDAPTPVDCLWKENRQLVKQFERDGLVTIIQHFRVKSISHDDTAFIVESTEGQKLHSPTRPIMCIGFLPNIALINEFVDTTVDGHDVLLDITDAHESKKTPGLFFAGTIGKTDPEHGFIRHFRDFGPSIVARVKAIREATQAE